MDLAGHHRFTTDAQGEGGAAADRQRTGALLLASAWAALATARAETVDLHLRTGLVIKAALAVRVDGPLGEASTRAGQWTHMFALEDVMLVHHVPRGGRRTDPASD